MESLNMNTLANSLPNSANAEKQLMDNFKAAALSITTLFRSSLDTSKRSYSAGYATCLLDVLRFVEAGVSVSGDEGEEMTIGRVMDWLEARLEAIKSTEEEAEEDRMKDAPAKPVAEEPRREESQKEEREKRTRKSSGSSTNPRLHRRSKENLHDVAQTTQVFPSNSQPSPSRTTSASLASPSPPPPQTRSIKQKRGLKEIHSSTPISSDLGPFPVTITPSPNFSPFTFSSDVVSTIPPIGSKRRHATMLSESPASSSVAASSTPTQTSGHPHTHGGGRRRRARGTRERELHHATTANGVNNIVQTASHVDAMEIEEDGGRERKRVARR